MKLLQVNVVYAKGSTGKIVADIDCRVRLSGMQSVVCYGRGERIRRYGVYKFCTEPEAAVQKILNRAGLLMYGGNRIATHRLINQIRQQRPDIVHIHCINGYCVNIYRLLDFLAREKIATVVTHHAEFFYTGSCGHALDCMRFTEDPGCLKCPRPRSATGALFLDRADTAWRRMLKSFSNFDRSHLVFTAVSPWLLDRSMLSPVISGFDCRVVENGLDTDIFKLLPDRLSARKHIPRCQEKVILHVTASFSDAADTFKGGDKIIELAGLMPDVTFVIAASYSSVSRPLPENVYLHGCTRNQQELAALYNAANLTVIASKRETFSMIVAESLSCGTPVIGFKAGGPESIGIDPFCQFIDRADNVGALADIARQMLNIDFDHKEISDKAHKKFSREAMVEGYLRIYNSLLNK